MFLKLVIPTLILVGATVGVLWMQQPPQPVPTPVPSQAAAIAPAIVTDTPTPAPHQNQAFMTPESHPAYVPARTPGVPDPVLDANAALVYDLDTDQPLFAKNESVRVPIASLTKVMTAMVVSDRLAWSDIVTVTSASVKVDTLKQTLNDGETILVEDLVKLMLVESSNDAAYALSDHAKTRGIDFIAEMNTMAVSLGMTDTLFTDPAGLDDEAYSTANDLVRLVRAANKRPELWNVMLNPSLTVRSVDGSFVHIASNTNELLDDLGGIRWGKTGNTDGALGCMMLVVKSSQESDTLVSIVLGSQARFTDTRELVGWASKAYGWNR